MRVLVSGATGFVGRFIVQHLAEHGHHVIAAGRHPPRPGFFTTEIDSRSLTLDPDAEQSSLFAGVDAFVHAAFQHVPGRYRGGEGSDAAGFLRANRDGSIRLFEAARESGVRHAIFLSSRAVYGRQAPGAVLEEGMEVQPDTLYGSHKLEVEQALAALSRPGFATTSLRATGVYGETAAEMGGKWESLLTDFRAGKPVADRVGTEVHGEDLAAAVRLLIESDAAESARLFNVSDVLTSHREILSLYAAEMGLARDLPEPADRAGFQVMASDRLRGLGWRPGSIGRLEETVRRIAAAHRK